MKKIAVVCAPGVGDALIFQIASHQLEKNGFEAATFSNHLHGFGKWFPHARPAPQPDPGQVEKVFAPFDAIFLQHDNSPKAKAVRSLPLPVYTFYGSHVPSKHGPLKKGFDFVSDPNRTMVDNVVQTLRVLFKIEAGKENGMQIPPDRIWKRWEKRVAIHPGSSNEEKNWPQKKYLEFAKRLKNYGLDPVFLAPLSEKSIWDAPPITTLEELSAWICESGFFIGNDSGPGHIASCLGIPHLIIAGNEKQMRLWRPGWTSGTVVLPPRWIPDWKQLRPHWKKFISTKKVINALKKSILDY